MAKELTIIQKKEANEAPVEHLMESAENREAMEEALQLLVQLQKAGVLNGLTSFLKKKDDAMEIVVEQINKDSVKQTINTMMEAGKLLDSLQYATDELQHNKTTGIMDLIRVLKDPDVNRALTFGLDFMRALGKELKKN